MVKLLFSILHCSNSQPIHTRRPQFSERLALVRSKLLPRETTASTRVEELKLSICVKEFLTFNSEGPFHTEERFTSVCKRGSPVISPTQLAPVTEGSDNVPYISLGSRWIEIILFAYSTSSNPANICVFVDRPPEHQTVQARFGPRNDLVLSCVSSWSMLTLGGLIIYASQAG